MYNLAELKRDVLLRYTDAVEALKVNLEDTENPNWALDSSYFLGSCDAFEEILDVITEIIGDYIYDQTVNDEDIPEVDAATVVNK